MESIDIEQLWHLLGSVEFWSDILTNFRHLGPLAPIFLAFLESVFPPIPFPAIVLFNVASYGAVFGFIYSWIGTCLGSALVFYVFRLLLRKTCLRLSDKYPQFMRARQWVEGINTPTLFVLILLPFTPSAFVNFAFGISDYSAPKYLITHFAGKLIRVAILVAIGKSTVNAFSEPCYILISIILLIGTYVISRKYTAAKVQR